MSLCTTIQPVTHLQATLVDDSDFIESEHPLVVEVTRSLVQRLGETSNLDQRNGGGNASTAR
jgi:hypothetical protein